MPIQRVEDGFFLNHWQINGTIANEMEYYGLFDHNVHALRISKYYKQNKIQMCTKPFLVLSSRNKSSLQG